MIKDLTKKAGIALILAALISIFRVLPIVLSSGVTRENFPPESLQDIVFFSQLQGWHISHVLILIIIPLFVFGTAVFAYEAAENGQASAGIMAFIGTTVSMILFSIATVLDGFALPAIARHINATELASSDTGFGALTLFTHEVASIFGGTATAFLLITALFFGIALLRGIGNRWLGIGGIILGMVSVIGYLTRILELNISDSFGRVGPLLMLMFFYLLAVGIVTFKRSLTELMETIVVASMYP